MTASPKTRPLSTCDCGAQKKAQLVKCFLGQCENLNLDPPRTHVQNMLGRMPGGVGTQRPVDPCDFLVSWSSLLVSSRPRGNFASKIIGRWLLRKFEVDLTKAHTCTCMDMNV